MHFFTNFFNLCILILDFLRRIMEEYIRLVIQVVRGSKSLFNKIHRGMMKEGKLKEFNPFFIKEQCDLYQWRKDFIKHSENLCTCCDTFKEQYIVDIFEYAMATECLDLEEEDEITEYIRQQQEVGILLQ